MGVRGWNRFLAQHGYLPPDHRHNSSTTNSNGTTTTTLNQQQQPSSQRSCCSTSLWNELYQQSSTYEYDDNSKYEMIPSGSTFHIDGLGLCSHIIETAYARHINNVLYSKLNHIQRPCCRINQLSDLSIQQARQLNPICCISYQLLHDITKEFITTLQRQCNIRLVVYWDGVQRYVYKQETDTERSSNKEQMWSHLHQYCTYGTLPPMIDDDQEMTTKKSRSPSKTSYTNTPVPLCEYFRKKFPFSNLYIKQIYYTLHVLNNIPRHECMNEADTILAYTVAKQNRNMKSNIHPTNLQQEQPSHYIVGFDSDFCFYENVQYIPLTTLQVHKNGTNQTLGSSTTTSYIMGCVITREKLASILHLPKNDTNLMIELAILLGNDYISSTTNKNNHHWTNDTMIQSPDLFTASNTPKKYSHDYKLSMDRVIYFIQNQSNQFQLHSSDPDIEKSIQFIRQLYNLQLPIDDESQLDPQLNGIYEIVQLRDDIAMKNDNNTSTLRPHLSDDEILAFDVSFTSNQKSIKETILRSLRNYMNYCNRNSGTNAAHTNGTQSNIIVTEDHYIAFEQLKIIADSGSNNKISYNALDQKVMNKSWRPLWNDILVVYVIEKIITQCIEQLQTLTSAKVTTGTVAATTTMKILYKTSSPHTTFDPYTYYVQLNTIREMKSNNGTTTGTQLSIMDPYRSQMSPTAPQITTQQQQLISSSTTTSATETPKKKKGKRSGKQKKSNTNIETNQAGPTTEVSTNINGGNTINNYSHKSSIVVEDGEEEYNGDVDEEVKEEEKLVLPVDEFENEIIESVYKNRVTIIQGETGCGKSSRIPIMLLRAPPPPDSIHSESKIFVSQPRRIAAKALVERLRKVEPDFRDQIALRMGHGVREYENKKTRAYFVTTGYLVRVVANAPEAFLKVTYLVIDEVHERSVDTDILCLLCRRMLIEYPHIRLVLMSATLAASLYQEYFDVSQPVIKVGARRFPVEEVYLSDLLTKVQLPGNKSKNVKWLSEECLKLKCMQPPPPNYTEKLLSTAAYLATVIGVPGTSVLIFVTGMNDIVTIIDSIETVSVPGTTFTCIPIHSDIPFEDQMTAFDQAKQDEVKIVIATNAAESSVTLPDVDNVICLGLCKQIEYNPTSHRQMLSPTWISRASATQRAGRTGRVRPGTVYRLYERQTFTTHMEAFEQGEMVRVPLDNVILSLKQMIADEAVTEVLTSCLEPPNLSTIERSFKSLFSSHFITSPVDDDTCKITQLGHFVSVLGIDLTLGSLVGLGIQFGVGAEAIQLAGILSFPKSPWIQSNPLFHEPREFNDMTSTTYSSRCHFDANLFSEPMAAMNLLWDYNQIPTSSEQAWCRKQGIFLPRLKRLSGTCDNLSKRVADFLKIPHDNIQVSAPPRTMPHAMLNILRIIQFWVFHDTLIEFDPSLYVQGHPECDNIVVKLERRSDRIEKKHLDPILKIPERHVFSLVSDAYVETTGSFPLTNEHLRLADRDGRLELKRLFQESIVSYSTNKGVELCVVDCKDLCSIYFTKANEKEILTLIPTMYHNTCVTLTATPHPTGKKLRGREERSCGLFKVTEGSGGKSNDAQLWCCITFPGSCRTSSTPNVAYFEAKFMRSLRLAFSLESLFDTAKIKVVKFSLLVKGIPKGMSDTDLKDLFDPKVQSTKNEIPVPQKIQISKANFTPISDGNSSWNRPPIQCIPEAARMLSVLASSRRGNDNVIKLPLIDDQKDPNTNPNNVEKSKTLDIYLEPMCNIMNRWKRFNDSKSKVFVEANSVPASAVPLYGTDILYCTCATALEIRGAKLLRVEGLTLLPPGKLFLMLCRLTWGLYKQENIDDGSYVEKGVKLVDPDSTLSKEVKKILKKRIKKAVHFHESSIELGERLVCFPDKVKHLIDIFNGVDGYDEDDKAYDEKMLSVNPFTSENLGKSRESVVSKQEMKDLEDRTARLMYHSTS